MAKTLAEIKVHKIKKALTTNFYAHWDDAWMDLSDVSQEQIKGIYFTLPSVDIITHAVGPDQAGFVMATFLKWFFAAFALRLSMREAVQFLSEMMEELAWVSLRNARIALLCHHGFAALIDQHPQDVGCLIQAFRKRFNIEYYDNGAVKRYETAFHLFMRANSESQSVLLIALAKVYGQQQQSQRIDDLLWEKGFDCMPKRELFKFLQAARVHQYIPLTTLRAYLRSIDHVVPKSDQLPVALRRLLDEINYTLAVDYLPPLIDELTKPHAHFAMRLFTSKLAQVFHKHWRVGDQVYSYREFEHLMMLYISRHPDNPKFKQLFSGHRLGKLLRHAPDFRTYMDFVGGKADISQPDSEHVGLDEELDLSFEVEETTTSEHSSSEPAMRMSA